MACATKTQLIMLALVVLVTLAQGRGANSSDVDDLEREIFGDEQTQQRQQSMSASSSRLQPANKDYVHGDLSLDEINRLIAERDSKPAGQLNEINETPVTDATVAAPDISQKNLFERIRLALEQDKCKALETSYNPNAGVKETRENYVNDMLTVEQINRIIAERDQIEWRATSTTPSPTPLPETEEERQARRLEMREQCRRAAEQRLARNSKRLAEERAAKRAQQATAQAS